MQVSTVLLLALTMLYALFSTAHAEWVVPSDATETPMPTPSSTTNSLRSVSDHSTNFAQENNSGSGAGSVAVGAIAIAAAVVGVVVGKLKSRRVTIPQLSPATPTA